MRRTNLRRRTHLTLNKNCINELIMREIEHLKDANYIGGLTMPKKPSAYLIKRSNVFRELKKGNSRNKGYFEIIITDQNRLPASIGLDKGDFIYVAETSGGIYAKGKVIDSKLVEEYSSVSKALELSERFNDDSYWLMKIRQFDKKLSKNPNVKLKIHEYFIDQKLLDKTIPYNGPLQRFDASLNSGLSHVFFKLTGDEIRYLLDEKNIKYNLKLIHKLDKEIPGDLRLRIHSFFNQNSSIGHIIDIDHFVPKSAGGPGNIIENLVPVGFSLNRYKSDLVPKSFFETALSGEYSSYFSKYFSQIKSVLEIDKKFISKKDVNGLIELSRSMNEEVSSWNDMNQIKKFYLEVNKSFNPDFAELIGKF